MNERISDRFANEVPDDIRLAPGTTHVVIIDTDSYSGNFERQMAAYCLGAYDDYVGEYEHNEFDIASEDDPRLEVIMDKVIAVTHAEYGERTMTIWATPGRLNNGRGGLYDEPTFTECGDDVWPAYQSVAVFLYEPLTEEEVALVLARAHDYSTKARSIGGNPLELKVTGIRQLTFEVVQTVTVTRK